MKQGKLADLSQDVLAVLGDYGNLLYTSSVCVHELIQLCQIGKVTMKDGRKRTDMDSSDVIPWLHRMNIEIVPITEMHLATLAELPMRKVHHDPFNRLIIAQAICDNLNIITPDHQFANYIRYGLKLTYNMR